MRKELISGFADEICESFTTQLETLNELGIKYICLRAIDGRGIITFTEEEAKSYILPTLNKYGVKVSSLGSPIGKIDIDDDNAFEEQLVALERLCKIANILDCKFIRLFSFWMPKGEDPEKYKDLVFEKMAKFIAICEKYDVIPMHENEKDIYGDIATRCKALYDHFANTTLCSAFDFANLVQCGEDTVKSYEMLKEYIKYVHIKDAVLEDIVLFGTGDGNAHEILKRLKNDGYDGHLTLEPHLHMFSSFKDLEIDEEAMERMSKSHFADGKSAFAAQYNALCEILDEI